MTLRPTLAALAIFAVAALPPAIRADDAADPTRYLVLDLTEANRYDAFYPVRFLAEPPEGGWNDDYKTNLVVLRRIDPGSVPMGCGTRELGYTGSEWPVREVSITKPFYIGVFELTQSQWRRVVASCYSRFAGDMRPVECVSWWRIRGRKVGEGWPAWSGVDEDCFIGILRSRTCISSWDLPTEAQWEFACRAGSTNSIAEGIDLVSTGRDPGLDRFARYSPGIVAGGSHGMPQHADVGSFEPNAWGLYDMHGNVSEWCRDWFAGRSSSGGPAPVADPVGPESSSRGRAVRGGSWFDYARLCRSASRSFLSPGESNPRTGFRLVCEPPTEEELAAAEAMAADVAAQRAENSSMGRSR